MSWIFSIFNGLGHHFWQLVMTTLLNFGIYISKSDCSDIFIIFTIDYLSFSSIIISNILSGWTEYSIQWRQ